MTKSFLTVEKPRSIKEHESGSDRIAEAVEMDVDVQGDEPFIDAEPLAKVIEVF
jgi:3-deoxy-manno-octulosonate cytidylyltransferase (CMP-KDO synthetase)